MEKLNKNKKWIAVIELIAAILLAIILFPLGLLYSLYLPFRKGLNFVRFIRYWKNLFIQIYTLIMYMFHSIAFTIDVLGNVIVGELIEDLITKQENTWFGCRLHSISQSIGQVQSNNMLNKFGKFLQKSIDFVFGKNHCINAYLFKLKNFGNSDIVK